MTRARGAPALGSTPRSTARACQFCRRRKIKCDALKPACTTCRTSNRTCSYYYGAAKPRPSTALLNAVRDEKNALEQMLVRLKQAATARERDALLDRVDVVDGHVRIRAAQDGLPDEADGMPGTGGPSGTPLPRRSAYLTPSGSRTREPASGGEDDEEDEEDEDDEEDADVADDNDTLHVLPCETRTWPPADAAQETRRYQLVANAAMSRQQEHRLRQRTTIRGVPAELALHLLDLHWNRQHHTYLLTYRPAFMRELVDGGDYCTDFLLYAVFACTSKFSERRELRTDPDDPATTGHDLFRRCEAILARDAVLRQSRIPTIVGLLMLGATYNARGRTSQGWLYTGYALRMVFDLGLHVEDAVRPDAAADPEEVEIRRRVFWGAFICDKLQSVYLGRPATIQLRDARVSRDFLDTWEELEPWAPYVDPRTPGGGDGPFLATAAAADGRWDRAVTHSVSVFQQLCLLARIMARIINQIYFSTGATPTPAPTPTTTTAPRSRRKMARARRQIDGALVRWYRELPPHLVYEPWAAAKAGGGTATATPPTAATPNLTILHTTYHCLVVLLHRPFIVADGDDDNAETTAAAHAWKRCTTAARSITNLALAYRATYPLRQSNYMLSYAVYVACTIHVHNAAAVFGGSGGGGSSNGGGDTTASDPAQLLRASLLCLDELAVPNSGAADTARIIRKLMAAKGIPEALGPFFVGGGSGSGSGSGGMVDAPFLAAGAGAHDMAALSTTALHSNNGELAPSGTAPEDAHFAWPLFDESPAFDPLAQLPSFSDFGLPGHDLLFGFMDGHFSPSEYMAPP